MRGPGDVAGDPGLGHSPTLDLRAGGQGMYASTQPPVFKAGGAMTIALTGSGETFQVGAESRQHQGVRRRVRAGQGRERDRV